MDDGVIVVVGDVVEIDGIDVWMDVNAGVVVGVDYATVIEFVGNVYVDVVGRIVVVGVEDGLKFEKG